MPEAGIRYAVQVFGRGERYGSRVVLALLATPWANGSDDWDNDSLKADMALKWGEVARRLKSYPALQMHDLINEPVVRHTLPGRNPQAHWHELTSAMVHELRAADPETPLMIEPAPWGLPSSCPATQPMIELGLVYSLHFCSGALEVLAPIGGGHCRLRRSPVSRCRLSALSRMGSLSRAGLVARSRRWGALWSECPPDPA
jgi:hypothetical protein